MQQKPASVRICEEIDSIRFLQMHPKYYTALITSDKYLALYDLLSLRLIWQVELVFIHPHLNSLRRPCVAFTLDFNEVYLVFQSYIYRLEYRPRDLQESAVCQPALTPIKLVSRSANIMNAGPLCLQISDHTAVLAHPHAIAVQQISGQERYFSLDYGFPVETIYALTDLLTPSSVVMLVCNLEAAFLCKVNCNDPSMIKVQLPIAFTLSEAVVYERARRLALLSSDRQEVEIYTYNISLGKDELTSAPQAVRLATFKFHHPIASLLFFSFAENTDTVNRRYRQLHLAYTRAVNNEFKVFLTNTQTGGSDEIPIGLSCTSADLYYNPLFNNSIISRTSTGHLMLTNLYGYDNEWVTLGFRFVSLDHNELYFEKEDDFETEAPRKRSLITPEDLDDYTYSLLGESELQHGERSTRIRRIRFEI